MISSTSITYPVTICLVKISILLLYLRIFRVNQLLRRLIVFGIVIQVLFYGIITCVQIGSIVKCSSLATSSLQFCKNVAKPLQALQQAFNVVTDFYILILPIPCVLDLQLGRRRKIGIILIFGSGLV